MSCVSPRAGIIALALLCCTAAPGWAQAGRPPQTPQADLATLDLEQLMELEVVYAASKRDQNPREVASVISVVTAAEIRDQGYRTLAEILRTLPSFYVSDDRNYSYVGVRGFGQPGDYNSRVLLLLNGLRSNDNIYDQAYIGEEFLLDVDLIDRVEVVRGPSGAVYGSSAFFAVINVVTKRGSDLNGAEVVASAGSFGTYGARASYGTRLPNAIEFLVSASVSDREGPARLYYPEFDDPSTNDGIARNADAERFHKLFASISKGNLSFEASHSTRDKAIPTASFETLFNDPRTRTRDRMSLASLTYERAAEKGSVSARIHTGRWHYFGEYPYEPAIGSYQDMAYGEWWGIDLDATRTVWNRSQLTAGLEYRDNYRQDQKNYTPDPYALFVNEYNASRQLGAFAQNELRILPSLILYTGVRQDWYETFGGITSPRLGLIFNPDEATTLKLMSGGAFRAPNDYELHYGEYLNFKPNPALDPERIRTIELAAERRIGKSVKFTASGFRNRITDLISLHRDPTDDLLTFENLGTLSSQGIELTLDLRHGGGATGHLAYAYQKTSDEASGARLVNSPEHLAEFQLQAPLARGLRAGFGSQYVGARKTLAGSTAKPFLLSNLTLSAPGVIKRVDLNATVYNLFGVHYGYPGSEEHRQDIIEQDGRTFRVKAIVRF